MKTFEQPTIAQLKRAIILRENITSLYQELGRLLGGNISTEKPAKGKRRKGMSAAGPARVAAAQRARWAKVKGSAPKKSETKPKRKMSAEARAAISAAAKARWKKAKASGKTTL